MAIATKEQLLKVLRAFNPWWTSGVVPSSFTKEYRRFAYYEAMKRLDQKDIRRTVVLTGTRRVGKTTIEYQMINTLIGRGVSPAQIVFISLDHPMLKLSNLSDILECYHENVWPTQDVYYFFDEIFSRIPSALLPGLQALHLSEAAQRAAPAGGALFKYRLYHFMNIAR